jgi:hypothetical protein
MKTMIQIAILIAILIPNVTFAKPHGGKHHGPPPVHGGPVRKPHPPIHGGPVESPRPNPPRPPSPTPQPGRYHHPHPPERHHRPISPIAFSL